MKRRQPLINRPLYKNRRDVGLYVISDDDILMENVNSILKRKGIIGVQDATGSVRYFVDGRHGLSKTVNRLQNLVTDFDQDPYQNDMDSSGMELYDIVAGEVFARYGFDFSLAGSNIIYAAVKEMIRGNLSINDNLKEIWAYNDVFFNMSYAQMVRNIRYSLSKTELCDLKTRTAIRLIAIKVGNAINVQKSMGGF
ncbi:MAG: hypothetical protein J6Z43_02635 [Clostridiales bacterium]|nr:hypothetical protein [Clostridiales bacterium]